jgi:hypothetical protein
MDSKPDCGLMGTLGAPPPRQLLGRHGALLLELCLAQAGRCMTEQCQGAEGSSNSALQAGQASMPEFGFQLLKDPIILPTSSTAV